MHNNQRHTTTICKTVVTVLFIGYTLLLLGCQQTKPLTKPAKIIPAWYISPPIDNDITLYGIGEGKTKDDAIQSALANLAGKLGTQIQAHEKLIKTQYTSAYRYNEEINQRTIESTIRKITLNQYKVVESEHVDYQQFLAMVSSNKLLLGKSLQQSLNQQIAHYETAKKSLSNAAGFSRFQFFAKQKQSLETFNNNLSALLTLKKSSHIQPYQNYLNDVQTNFKHSHQQTVFYIKHQPTANYIEKVISDKLLQAGLKTTKNSDEATNVINITTSLKQTKAYEFMILRESVELETLEANKPTGGNQFTLKGQGLSLQQAQQQLANNFKIQLQQDSLETALGINQE